MTVSILSPRKSCKISCEFDCLLKRYDSTLEVMLLEGQESILFLKNREVRYAIYKGNWMRKYVTFKEFLTGLVLVYSWRRRYNTAKNSVVMYLQGCVLISYCQAFYRTRPNWL